MANKVYNMAGGSHSAEAYSAFENAMYGSCVATENDYAIDSVSGMNVVLGTGYGLISTGTGHARRIGPDSTNNVTVAAASASNPRIDAIVAYIDMAVSPSTSYTDNSNNILKFASVAGSPSASPTAPSASAITNAIGAGNPYMILYYVNVGAGVSSLTTTALVDNRIIAGIEAGPTISSGSTAPSGGNDGDIYIQY